jgi:hypothetical protein
MSDIPRKPTGRSDEARFARWAHDKLANQSRLGRVSGHRVMNTTRGPMMVPGRAPGGTATGNAAPYRVRVVYDDYYVCRDWDGTTLGSSDVLVAKPKELWCSTTEEEYYQINTGTSLPEFVTATYTYADDPDEPFMEWPGADNEWDEEEDLYLFGGALFEFPLNTIRTVTIGLDTEDRQVTPIFRKGDVIWALESDWTGVTVDDVALDLIEVLPARAWAAIG